jgi:hypothetical protein
MLNAGPAQHRSPSEEVRETASKSTYEWPDSPYKGINYFTAHDAPLFAEREVEVDQCAEIIGRPSTRVLLLHGLSGTGKSSFLRAGLLPRLAAESGGFDFLQADDGQPLLVRSTDDPVARLAEAVLAKLCAGEEFSCLSAERRTTLSQFLARALAAPDRAELSGALLSALKEISRYLRRPLVLVVDQAEELLTIAKKDDTQNKQSAFFHFLEDVCAAKRTPVKIILALRTEYYGEFCNGFRFLPNVEIAPNQFGLEQFLLFSFHDSAQLTSAILRPTLAEPVGSYGVPFKKYRFRYEDGLALLIAGDVITHCGDLSTLPVMQIVCLELYRAVVVDVGRDLITLKDYRRLGGVPGRVEAFVEGSIRAALARAQRRPVRDNDIRRWQEILATLAISHEGGTVTTTFANGQRLGDLARDKKVRGPVAGILDAMTEERVLRCVSAGENRESREYSLGHDAIALTLYKWNKEQEKLSKAKARTRIWKVAAALGAGIILIGAGGFFYSNKIWNYKASYVLSSYAAAENSYSARFRILLLLAALQKTDRYAGFFGIAPSEDELLAQLRQVVLSAPVYFGTAEAIGLNPHGNQLLTLQSDGQAFLIRFDGGHREPLGQIGGNELLRDTLSLPRMSVAGFLSGNPVIYRFGSIAWKDGESWQRTPILPMLARAEVSQNWFWLEVLSDAIRLNSFGGGTNRYLHVGLDDLKRGALSSKPTALETQSLLFLPTTSDYSAKMAIIDPGGDGDMPSLLIMSSTDPAVRERVGKLAFGKHAENETTSARPRFIRSIAFAPGDRAVALREDKDHFTVYGFDGDASLTFAIPEWMQNAMIRPSWQMARPALAAAPAFGEAGAERAWRFAWLAHDGVLVSEAYSSGFDLPAPKPWPILLTSMAAPEGFVKLRFSVDGRWLSLLISPTADRASYRVWDLDGSRAIQISLLSKEQLWELACKVAAVDPVGARFTDDEKTWSSIASQNPCE